MINRRMEQKKLIALVAHDNKKNELLEWVSFNQGNLSRHVLYATGTTGEMIKREVDLDINILQSGPLGGDLQVGAMIAAGDIDFLVFFWDPLQAQPHDPDVKALLRIAVVWNVPVASNRASADFMFSSPLLGESYDRRIPDYNVYRNRFEDER
ncbi:MAG: methylglyoxal synthase [Anaerolineales bacterium]|nr:methylglyoxal synthase [Anaerolineales bacterium]